MDSLSQQKFIERHVELMAYNTSSTDVTQLSRNDHILQRHFQDDLNKPLSSEETLKKSLVSKINTVALLVNNVAYC